MPPPLPKTDVAPWAGTLVGECSACAGSPARAVLCSGGLRRGLRQNRNRVRGDRLDLRGGALELVIRQHRCALERQLALDLDPRAAATVLVAHLDGDGPRDAVGAEHDHVERMAAL